LAADVFSSISSINSVSSGFMPASAAIVLKISGEGFDIPMMFDK
jgi:hypothetical protein